MKVGGLLESRCFLHVQYCEPFQPRFEHLLSLNRMWARQEKEVTVRGLCLHRSKPYVVRPLKLHASPRPRYTCS